MSPLILPLDAGGVPLFLRQQHRWAIWSAATRKGGKLDKIPKHPLTLHNLSVTAPNEWVDFDTALAACRRHRASGMAYLMTGVHGVVGIDLDRCLADDDTPLPWAQEILDRVRGYAELSPSGNGLRIFVRGTLPADVTRTEFGVELYSGHTPRFLTVTGQRLPDSPLDVPQADPAALEWLWQHHAPKVQVLTDPVPTAGKPEPIPDEQLPTAADLLDLGMSRRDVALLTDPDARFDDYFDIPGQRLDKSGQCFRLAKLLAGYGFTAPQIYSILRRSAAVVEVALAHRPRATAEVAEVAADTMIWSRWASVAAFQWQRQREFAREAVDVDDILHRGLTIEVEALPSAEKTPPKTETEKGVAEKPQPKAETKIGVIEEQRKAVLDRAAEFKLYTLGEFMAIPRYKQQWLISKVLPFGELGFIVGNRGSGKTFFALDMIIHLANGWEWRHLKVKPSKVIYYAAEGANGLQNRVAAWEQFNQRSARCDNLVLLAPEAGLNLADPIDYAAMTLMLQQAGGADLIVIDTFSQVTPGLDENSGQVMSELIARTVKWARKNGCMVLFIGHTGKNADAGLRGWSGLQAAADVIIAVERDAKTEEREAVLAKLKEGQDMLRLPFRLERVRFPDQQTNLGDPVESSLAYAVGAPLEPPRGARVPTLDDMILATVADWQGLPEAEGQPLDAARLAGHVLAQRPEYTGAIVQGALDRLVRAGLVIRTEDGALAAP